MDIVVHSATKWIGGHGTTIGGVIVDGGRFDWEYHKDRFPQFHEEDTQLWNRFKWRAFAMRCQYEILRDVGCTLGAPAAQQLLIGLESLAVRCERHAFNAAELAAWLRSQPQIGWVSYLGDPTHPYHQRAAKYLRRGFGAILSFGIKGGKSASFQVCDALKLVTITTKYSLIHQPFIKFEH